MRHNSIAVVDAAESLRQYSLLAVKLPASMLTLFYINAMFKWGMMMVVVVSMLVLPYIHSAG